MTTAIKPDAWQTRAACRHVNAELFFPERGASTADAKSVCRGCPVRAECLDYAISNGEKFGIWGGLSERERRRIRRGPRPVPSVRPEHLTVIEGGAA